ncbi:2S seed storage protein 1 [Citrus sinensis]|uniref:Bifunctional inhibitor/plant lipid transfer protein/seed storage helical domain-containing protein n=1 Tax=Citrus clementina TaxID=85681 RepID=V4USD3_CITCL|nr:2S seed storage protein 1 [Citrus x clementina]XP_006475229.1 2S seed storage albumin protein-like [Citrus sinensis]ESR65431.1 hypothetical protein CICLE_v10009789mg [Citrus x clementina]KAH9651434.1 2S seed storage protein 1 [Citrus sinensis]
MANKLILLLSTFALFLLVANSSIYRTTIFIDEENPSQQSCEQQIQQQQQLRQCQMHLRQQVRDRQQEGEDGLWGSSLGDNQQQQYLRQCCQQLQQLDNRCRCPGLEQALRSQLQQGQIQGGMLRQAYESASQIPRKCNISPRQGCDFSSPYF